MANPRQRRKAKSSSHRAISHSKRAKRLRKKMPSIRGPKALQDAWSPSKTVRQNYLALGLQHDLDPIPSGGFEMNISHTMDSISKSVSSCAIDDSRLSVSEGPTMAPKLPKGFGRIVRDSSGNIVRVELPGDEDAEHAPEREPEIDPPVAMTETDLRIWAHNPREGGSGGTEDVIVLGLEHLAASATIHERHTSSGEKLYLERLVDKYGDDLQKMARDRRLNPAQRTANELKRAITKAGGFGALYRSTVANVTE